MDNHNEQDYDDIDEMILISIQQVQIKNLNNTQLNWNLNQLLISSQLNFYTREYNSLTQKLKLNQEILNEASNKVNLEVIKHQKIIGTTTTGASKYKSLINQVGSQIVIIEEAAEILEAHVATSLTESVQHLILIGDHQQLKPNVTIKELAYKYNLDISLFERLVQNKFEQVTLSTQRRMRPEISGPIKIIYPNLQDDESVKNYPPVRGTNNKNYFFMDHKFEEKSEEQTKSKFNVKEAELVVRLSDYLLKQKYTPDQITILALYTGQIMCLKNMIKQFKKNNKDIGNIKLRTVDNYQGEENDIIIVSLVRSNHKNETGFLKASNRICVALSRAKEGLFIFGNANCLRKGVTQYGKQSEIKEHLWIKIINHLQVKQLIGNTLELKCFSHGKITNILQPEDFDKAPQGGCNQVCGARQNCGHKCEILCHYFKPTEKDQTGHDEIKCQKQCAKVRICGHKCTYKCYQCKYKEQPCITLLPRTLKCGHTNQYQCDKITKYQEIFKELECYQDYQKPINCETCGNDNIYKCQEVTSGKELKCQAKLTKILSCNHEAQIVCSQSVAEHEKNNKCQEYCRTELECGHECQLACYQCNNQTMFHQVCQKTCDRVNIKCNHTCKSKCHGDSLCPPCQEECQIKCSHSRCIQKCGETCKECVEPCQYKCDHSQCKKKCFEPCDREPCKEPCLKKLKCGHNCISFCGIKCPQICKQKDCNYYDEEIQAQLEIIGLDENDEEAKNLRFIQLQDCGHLILEISLQALFDGLNEEMIKNQKEGKHQIVKYLSCPMCRKYILNCPLYEKTIKQTHTKVNEIKQTIKDKIQKYKNENMKDEHFIKIQKLEIYNTLLQKKLGHQVLFEKTVQKFLDRFQEIKQNPNLSNTELETIVTQQTVLIHLYDFLDKNVDIVNQADEPQFNSLKHLLLQFQHLNVNEQRLKSYLILIKYFEIGIKVKNAMIQNKGINFGQQLWKIQMKYNLYIQTKLLNEQQFKMLKEELKPYEKYLNFDLIEMIFKATGLGKGHWFQCPNGHYYAIGDCGGAMEESKCPDCKEKIGGKNHSLRDDNKLAQIGGQTLPKWQPNNLELNLQYALQIQNQQNNF